MSNRNNDFRDDRDEDDQRHVHELLGSTRIAEEEEDPHNHRFATVTGEARPLGSNDHFHEVFFRTDNFNDHFHEFCGRTGGAIPVGNNRHVHFIEGVTTENDDHRHRFIAATLIENPIGRNRRRDDNNHRDECNNRNRR